jgi:hypothetical protein
MCSCHHRRAHEKPCARPSRECGVTWVSNHSLSSASSSPSGPPQARLPPCPTSHMHLRRAHKSSLAHHVSYARPSTFDAPRSPLPSPCPPRSRPDNLVECTWINLPSVLSAPCRAHRVVHSAATLQPQPQPRAPRAVRARPRASGRRQTPAAPGSSRARSACTPTTSARSRTGRSTRLSRPRTPPARTLSPLASRPCSRLAGSTLP